MISKAFFELKLHLLDLLESWWNIILQMKKPKMMMPAMLISSFQIVSFLGKERMVEFLGLKSNEERISFMYRHEAYRPLLQVLWQILLT